MRYSNLLHYRPKDLYLLSAILIIGFLAKGSASFRGSSIDDYAFSFGANDGSLLGLFLNQGRYISWIIAFLIDSLSVNLNDTYFSFGIITIILQSILVVSVIRFITLNYSLYKTIAVGSIMMCHPYFSEILTFKVILPIYSFALLLTIFSLESANYIFRRKYGMVITFLLIFLAIITYQGVLNYLIVAAFGSTLYCALYSKNFKIFPSSKSAILLILSGISGLLVILLMYLTKYFGLVRELTNRSNLIDLSYVNQRYYDVLTTLNNILVKSEPVFPLSIKTIFIGLIIFSLAFILLEAIKYKNIKYNVIVFSLILSIPIIIIGLILPFKDWWPVPRVLAHASLLFGALFLISDRTRLALSHPSLTYFIGFFRLIVVIAFVLINNQIFADQQKIMQWDRFQANRIVSRLEEKPSFSDLRAIYVDGGRWAYPAPLRMVQGDMNTSAFMPTWSKVSVIYEASGYKFSQFTPEDKIRGAQICKNKSRWPHPDAVSIEGDLGVICLPNP